MKVPDYTTISNAHRVAGDMSDYGQSSISASARWAGAAFVAAGGM